MGGISEIAGALVSSFTLSVIIVEGVLPVLYAVVLFLGWFFSSRGANETVNVITQLTMLIAETAIPWWLNPLAIVLVIVIGIGISAYLLSQQQGGSYGPAL